MGCGLCPVAAVLTYAAARRPGPFIITPAARALTKQGFMGEIKVLGFPDHEYARRSFRVGATMSVAMAGVEDPMIQLWGRWQSPEFLRYIRTLHEWLASISSTPRGAGSL